MPTVEDRLKQATLKIERAKEHAAELNRQIAVFFGANPYKVATKIDPDTKKIIYYVSSVEPIPDDIPLIAGDVIQNLMSD